MKRPLTSKRGRTCRCWNVDQMSASLGPTSSGATTLAATSSPVSLSTMAHTDPYEPDPMCSWNWKRSEIERRALPTHLGREATADFSSAYSSRGPQQVWSFPIDLRRGTRPLEPQALLRLLWTVGWGVHGVQVAFLCFGKRSIGADLCQEVESENLRKLLFQLL